jgi:hypothetical protein
MAAAISSLIGRNENLEIRLFGLNAMALTSQGYDGQSAANLD